jgi:hypothetical protein
MLLRTILSFTQPHSIHTVWHTRILYKKSPSSPKINHSITLGIEFQLLTKMRGFVVYSTLKHIHDRTTHRGRKYVRNWGSLRCTETCVWGFISHLIRLGLNPFRVPKTLGGWTIGITTNCDSCGVRAKVTQNYIQLKNVCGKIFVVDVGTGRRAVRNVVICQNSE